MTNEEQLRKEWRKQTEGKYSDDETRRGAKLVADWWLAKLHQAELNWITAQIERGEGMKKENPTPRFNAPKNQRVIYAHSRRDGYNTALTDLLAPLIERKKELEDIIRNTPEHE